MFCPKCGNELDLFAEKCLSCGKSFRNMSLAEKQRYNRKPVIPQRNSIPKRKSIPKRIKRKVKSIRKDSVRSPKVNVTTRIEYNNGYATPEGMSIRGTKFRKGSFKKRNNNEGCGFSFPVNSLDHY